MEPASVSSESVSTTARLEQAVERLDQKLGSMDEWMHRTDATFEDFQTRWHVCSQSISTQLTLVEQELSPDDRPPHLRIF